MEAIPAFRKDLHKIPHCGVRKLWNIDIFPPFPSLCRAILVQTLVVPFMRFRSKWGAPPGRVPGGAVRRPEGPLFRDLPVHRTGESAFDACARAVDCGIEAGAGGELGAGGGIQTRPAARSGDGAGLHPPIGSD